MPTDLEERERLVADPIIAHSGPATAATLA